jgi:FAD:protein FMN transferase
MTVEELRVINVCSATNRFAAMNCAAELIVTAGTSDLAEDLANHGEAIIHRLEQLWSRFLPDSDVSAINHGAGTWVPVQQWTIDIASVAQSCRVFTNGLFNPLLGADQHRNGYHRSFVSLDMTFTLTTPQRVIAPRSHDGAVEIDLSTSRIRIPTGAKLDFGGIGKGYAGDILVNELVAAGATGVMLNLGGDVRIHGVPPSGECWSVALDLEPALPLGSQTLLLTSGAVAVSSPLFRKWATTAGSRHHVLDPTTGNSVNDEEVAFFGVIASTGWWAEALTTALMVKVARSATDIEYNLSEIGSGAHAMRVNTDGTMLTSSLWNTFVAQRQD